MNVRELNFDAIFALGLRLETADDDVEGRSSKSIRNNTGPLIYVTPLPKFTRISFASRREVVREIHCASSRFVLMTPTPASQWAKGFRGRANPCLQISDPEPSSLIYSAETLGSKNPNQEKGRHPGPQIVVRPHDWFGPISRTPQPKPQKHPKFRGVPDNVEPWVEKQPPKEAIDDRVSFGVLRPGHSRPIKKEPPQSPFAREIPQKDHSDYGEPSFGLKRRGESRTRTDPPPLPIHHHHPEKQSYSDWFGVPKQYRDSPPVDGSQSNWQPEGLFGLKQRRELPAHLYPHPVQLAQPKPRVDPTYNSPNIVNSSINLNQKSSQPILLPNPPRAHPAHSSQQADGIYNNRNSAKGLFGNRDPRSFSGHLPVTEHHFDEGLNLNQLRKSRGQTDPDSNQPVVEAKSENSHPTDWFGKPDKYVRPHSTKPRRTRWLSDGAFGLKLEQQRVYPTNSSKHVEDKNTASHSVYPNHRGVPTQPLGPSSVDEVGSHSNADSSILNPSMEISLHTRVPVDAPLENKRIGEGPTKHPEPSDQPVSQFVDELLQFIRSRTSRAEREPGGTTLPVSKVATTITGHSREMASLKQSYRFDPPAKAVRKLDNSIQDPMTVLAKETPIIQQDPFVGQPLIYESPKTFQPRLASFRSLRPYTESKGLSVSISQGFSEHVPRKTQVLPSTKPRSMIIHSPSFFSDTLRQSRGAISDQVANQKKSLRQRPALLAAHRLRQLRNAVSVMTDKDKNAQVLSPALVKWPNGLDNT